jgi:hypothetical protein
MDFPEELDNYLSELENGRGGELYLETQIRDLTQDLQEARAQRDDLQHKLNAKGYDVVVHGHEFPFFGVDYPMGKLLLPPEINDRVQEVQIVEAKTDFEQELEVEIVPPCAEWMLFCIKLINKSGKDLALRLSGGETLVVRKHSQDKVLVCFCKFANK